MWHGFREGWVLTSEAMRNYKPKMMFPVLSLGNKFSHVWCGAMGSLVKNGVGVIEIVVNNDLNLTEEICLIEWEKKNEKLKQRIKHHMSNS